ncbi:MAG: nucleotidyltransferase family protein [Terriglobales bacterium]
MTPVANALSPVIDSAKLAEICRRHEVRELCVFGSAARGEATENSDLDILVEFRKGRKPTSWILPVLRRSCRGHSPKRLT